MTKPVILLVDDEPSILNALQRSFRGQGFRLLLASGGQPGLALLAQEKVDLVISDYRMPGMNGEEFLLAVRELYPAARRILLSGYSSHDSEQVIASGVAHRLIRKPWVSADLLRQIRECLSDQSDCPD